MNKNSNNNPYNISYNIWVTHMATQKYDRLAAVAYANKWALARNPKYYNFDPVGGDCTSFVSQCLFAGSKVMNYTPIKGWYYRSGFDKSPSWSGVEFLYNFLIRNNGMGPRGRDAFQNELQIGDIAQLSFDGISFTHSLFIIDIKSINDLNKIYIATHTYDSLHKSIGEYIFSKIRFIHIENVGI